MKNECEIGNQTRDSSEKTSVFNGKTNVFESKILQEMHNGISKCAERTKMMLNLRGAFKSLKNIKNGILAQQDRAGTLNSNIFCVKIE